MSHDSRGQSLSENSNHQIGVLNWPALFAKLCPSSRYVIPECSIKILPFQGGREPFEYL